MFIKTLNLTPVSMLGYLELLLRFNTMDSMNLFTLSQ